MTRQALQLALRCSLDRAMSQFEALWSTTLMPLARSARGEAHVTRTIRGLPQSLQHHLRELHQLNLRVLAGWKGDHEDEVRASDGDHCEGRTALDLAR